MRQVILSTLAHYEAERGVPLSAFEIYKYLHKQNLKNLVTESLSFLGLLKKLEELVEQRLLRERNGFYFLTSPKQNDHYQKRIAKDKTSVRKWRKAQRMISFMQVIPFIGSISVAGSLSMNNATEKSDIDLFITTKEGRVWTVRTLSMLLTQALGQRRHDKKISDKVCLNYYITENSFPEVQNLASANVFLRTVPILNKKTYERFYKKNISWIGEYFQRPTENFEIENLRKIKENVFFNFKRRSLEFLLKGKVGDSLEKYLANWQKKRIGKKIEGKKDITNLIFTDNILMFHYPNPRNEEVLKKYNSITKGLKT